MSRSAPLLHCLASTFALAGILFVCAGRLDLPMMWAYPGVYWCLGLMTALTADGSLDAERRQPGPGAIDPESRLAASILFLATVAVSALDAGRGDWTRTVPEAAQLVSLAVFALVSAVQTWSMVVNPFFSTAIRIQAERGHRLITDGPYRFIRHPGYLAMAVTMPATALALGSFVALIPAFLYSALVLWRTRTEDRFLRQELRGYSEYTGMVRHRLIPGLW